MNKKEILKYIEIIYMLYDMIRGILNSSKIRGLNDLGLINSNEIFHQNKDFLLPQKVFALVLISNHQNLYFVQQMNY